MATKAATLPSVIAIGSASCEKAQRRAGFQHRRERRQQYQREHHRHVFDDQPTDRDAPAFGLEQAPFLHRAQENDRACDRQGEAEHDARAHRPAEPPRKSHAERGSDRDLCDGAGDGDAPDREQIFEREMQADAEHQQDHADLGEFVGDALVGDVSRGERADEDAGDEITDQRRKSQPLRHHAEYECQHQGDDDGGDQRRVVRHRQKFLRSAGAPPLIPTALQLVLSFIARIQRAEMPW